MYDVVPGRELECAATPCMSLHLNSPRCKQLKQCREVPYGDVVSMGGQLWYEAC